MSNWKNHYPKLAKTKALLTSATSVWAAAIVLLAVTINAHAQFKYTNLSAPGSEGTQVYGISGNNIVGFYWYTNGGGEAFIYNINTGTYTNLSVPGTGWVTPLGIDGTNIVGISDLGAFLYNGSTCTILSMPGAGSTYALGVSGNNIVGWYESTGPEQGFLYNGNTGTYTTLNMPGEQSTTASGIDGTNIVGTFWPPGGAVSQGFLYNGSTYTTVSVPGAVFTYANGISSNTIVGSYANATAQPGFAYDMSTGTYTSLSMPGARDTYAEGVSGGHIVGSWYDTNGYQHGFLATPTLYLQAAAVGGQFQLTVSGPPAPATVEASTNMLDWVPVCTNTPPFTFTDSPSALFPCRFYQAVSSQ